jgi:hypothetical protein
MMPFRERLTQPVPAWRVAVVAFVVAGAGVAAGVGIGRLHALEEVTEQVVVVTRTHEVQVVRWRATGTSSSRTTSTPVVLAAPDGGVVLAAATTTETRESWSTEGSSSSSSESSSSNSRTSSTVSRPDWRVGLLVGATWKEPALKLGDTPLVIGATVERRIIGPFSLGAWGTTQGAAGLSVAGEF